MQDFNLTVAASCHSLLDLSWFFFHSYQLADMLTWFIAFSKLQFLSINHYFCNVQVSSQFLSFFSHIFSISQYENLSRILLRLFTSVQIFHQILNHEFFTFLLIYNLAIYIAIIKLYWLIKNLENRLEKEMFLKRNCEKKLVKMIKNEELVNWLWDFLGKYIFFCELFQDWEITYQNARQKNIARSSRERYLMNK